MINGMSIDDCYWTHTSRLYGRIRPDCMGAYVQIVWTHTSRLHGRMRPDCMFKIEVFILINNLNDFKDFVCLLKILFTFKKLIYYGKKRFQSFIY